MNHSRILSLATALALLMIFASGDALAKDSKPSFMQELYLPELVMQNHRAIGLSKDQRKTITNAIQATSLLRFVPCCTLTNSHPCWPISFNSRAMYSADFRVSSWYSHICWAWTVAVLVTASTLSIKRT